VGEGHGVSKVAGVTACSGNQCPALPLPHLGNEVVARLPQQSGHACGRVVVPAVLPDQQRRVHDGLEQVHLKS
jgi:hypothetical protein